ncbi:putative E3 ubiquitin-protein ligase TRIML1 [Sminthopsis crassicaudata]|uniref:putative E3 ubiquitin-protein ligase TRIML1 n=1 Tax=Sminthopsis crassicaudata TaxID=9301 RepID=UPI003D6883E1
MSSFLEPTEELQKELLCSICGNFFTDPVFVECGHNFCHYCLLTKWQEVSSRLTCPECKRAFQLRDFKVNKRLGKLAAIAKNLEPHSPQDLEDRGKCEVHQNMKTLFCEDDQRPVCVSCSQTEEHESHTLYCMDEAAKIFREKLQEIMTDLKKKTKNSALQMSRERSNFVIFNNQRENQKNYVLFEFQKMEQFLEEEMDFYLECVQTWGAISSESLSNRISLLSQQKKELNKRITELEVECLKPDLDLLQEMKGILSENNCVLQRKIEAFTIRLTVPPILDVMQWIYNWKVDITLDCNTADAGLIISENLKSMRYGGSQGEALNSYERAKDFVKVLGAQACISGRYYWEVEVPGIINWCVGIHQKSKNSQNYFVLSNTLIQNVPSLYVMARHHLYSQIHLKYRQVCISNLKVGIFLDYEGGEMSFYDATHGYLIYTFPPTSFSGPFLPLFCLPKKECSLSICP